MEWVREHYNVSKQPKDSIIAGFSLGGLEATYAALKNPNVFGKVISQSGSFWWCESWGKEISEGQTIPRGETIIEKIKDTPQKNIEIYMEVGTGEGKEMEICNGATYDALKSKGYSVKFLKFVGIHDWISWSRTLEKSLIYFLGQ